jgi:hypothetical protein
MERNLPKMLDLKSIVEPYLPSSKLSILDSLFNDIISWATNVAQDVHPLGKSENNRRVLNLAYQVSTIYQRRVLLPTVQSAYDQGCLQISLVNGYDVVTDGH